MRNESSIFYLLISHFYDTFNTAFNHIFNGCICIEGHVLRNYKQALWRGQVNDYSLSGLQGKELHDLTVGVMGTGNIGRTFVQLLSGFGCRILAYDLQENEDVKKYATYVDKDTLLKESDAISLHLPLFKSTYHLINKETIQKMKDNVILINCSRGELIDTEDIIEASRCANITFSR